MPSVGGRSGSTQVPERAGCPDPTQVDEPGETVEMKVNSQPMPQSPKEIGSPSDPVSTSIELQVLRVVGTRCSQERGTTDVQRLWHRNIGDSRLLLR